MFSITFFIQMQNCQRKWILRIEFQCLDSAHEAESDSVGGSKGESHFTIFDDSGLFWKKMNKPVQRKFMLIYDKHKWQFYSLSGKY